jgi:hypothetical protein
MPHGIRPGRLARRAQYLGEAFRHVGPHLFGQKGASPREPLMVLFQTAKLRRGVRMFRATRSSADDRQIATTLQQGLSSERPINHQRGARCQRRIGAAVKGLSKNHYLTAKAPYKFESSSLQRCVTCEPTHPVATMNAIAATAVRSKEGRRVFGDRSRRRFHGVAVIASGD